MSAKILRIDFFNDHREEPNPAVTAVTVRQDTTPEEAAAIKQVVETAFPGRQTRVFEQPRGPRRLA